MALAAIRARLRQAIVHVRLAQRASEARHAEAAERIDQVGARASVQARIIRLAVIDVRLAQWARKTRWAYTFETVHLVDTRAAILAPIHSAVIHLFFFFSKTNRKETVGQYIGTLVCLNVFPTI